MHIMSNTAPLQRPAKPLIQTTASIARRTQRKTAAGLCAAALALASLTACGGGDSVTTVITSPTTTGAETWFTKSVVTSTAHPASVIPAKVLTGSSTSSATAPSATEILNWAEATFPTLFSAGVNQTWGTYVYRYYPATDLVLGINAADGTWVAITNLGSAQPAKLSLGLVSQYACNVFPSTCHTSSAGYPLNQRAGVLASVLGKPKRMLIGLGTATVADIQAQSLKPDIHDHYLVGSGEFSWRLWSQPDGAYVREAAANADKVGAVPMFTLYQMATWGDGNFFVALPDQALMKGFWDNVRIMYQQIKLYGKPALVNLEPDFWGYTHRVNSEPSQHFAHVASANPDCANQPNSVAGLGECLVQMARTLAPNAYVGFPPSMFGDLVPNELAYMQKVGASKADFVVMQTLDRDAGCYEAFFASEDANCNRLAGTKFYWDAANLTAPTFTEHFAIARNLHVGLGLPLLWWQTPMGVPSATTGGSRNAFRDNRVEYFLTRSSEVVAAGGMGVVFSPGHVTQTNINTDGGQFKRLSTQYLAAPAALP